MDILRRFNGDFHTKEALVEYLGSFIDQEGLRRIYSKESVEVVADAKLLILKAFEQLEIDYGVSEKKIEAANQAR